MVKHLFLFVLKQTLILGAFVLVVLLAVRIKQEKSPPDLKVWHTVVLANEFSAASRDVPDFNAYLALEEKLFQELKDKVEDRLDPADQTPLNRYFASSLSSPHRQPRDGNRSFVSIPKSPQGSVVLIHGLTDSPYSMHAIADIFIQHGFAVFVVRMPGHGTTPGSLLRVTWLDWVAAVRLAAVAARQSAPGKPLILCGYSNGGLLSVKYTLDEIAKGDAGQPPQKIILFAPAIGITRFAAVSSWYRALIWIPYFKKAAWLGLEPEYDPFKYNSFPKMASDQIYRLTKMVDQQLADLQKRDRFGAFPPVLTFTSVVDSTVLTPSLVGRLYSRLRSNGSELVLYDVNRSEAMQAFITDKHEAFLQSLRASPTAFALTLITNRQPSSLEVVARRRTANRADWIDEPLHEKWPLGVYSLSHLAIPNSPEDPLYGSRPDLRVKGQLVLGQLQPRGETGVLEIPASQLLRLRFNPFFEPMRRRINEFVN